MQTSQIAVRLPDELLAKLDREIPQRFASRADAVRQGLDAVLSSPSLSDRVAEHQNSWAKTSISVGGEQAMRADALALIAEEPW